MFSIGYKGQKSALLNSLTDACKGEHKIFGNIPKMLGNERFDSPHSFYQLGGYLNRVRKVIVAQALQRAKVNC